MVVTLYIPGQPSRAISPEGFELPDPTTGFACVPDCVAEALGCPYNLVDVQACGPAFVSYSIYDYEGEINLLGMAAIERWSKQPCGFEEEDQLRGPLLLVTA
ncbi:MAG: hypothetical protein EOO61_02735 [Hymenobacter sp.]|nr:MAG: hypothetical protein EOO61_02735 [Hymenobacter sp.]